MIYSLDLQSIAFVRGLLRLIYCYQCNENCFFVSVCLCYVSSAVRNVLCRCSVLFTANLSYIMQYFNLCPARQGQCTCESVIEELLRKYFCCGKASSDCVSVASVIQHAVRIILSSVVCSAFPTFSKTHFSWMARFLDALLCVLIFSTVFEIMLIMSIILW